MSAETTDLVACECGGQHFALVPLHRPDIPLHMEPTVNIDTEGHIVGYSGRLMCVYCNMVLPDPALDAELTARKMHPANTAPDIKGDPAWDDGVVLPFGRRSR